MPNRAEFAGCHVQVRSVGKMIGRRPVLDDVSFDASPGTLTVIHGPNGSGKSTLFRAMVGIVQARGRTTFGGRTWCELAMPRATVGVYLGADSFHRGARVGDHVSMVAGMAGAGRVQVDRIIDRFGLAPLWGARVGTLSLGTRQRVGLGVALLGDPPLILLDEPAGALDPGESRDLHQHLAKLAHAGHTSGALRPAAELRAGRPLGD